MQKKTAIESAEQLRIILADGKYHLICSKSSPQVFDCLCYVQRIGEDQYHTRIDHSAHDVPDDIAVVSWQGLVGRLRVDECLDNRGTPVPLHHMPCGLFEQEMAAKIIYFAPVAKW